MSVVNGVDISIENEVLYCDEIAQAAREAGGTHEQVREGVQERATRNHPTYIGMVESVSASGKEGYTIKFHNGTVRATDRVATFLLTEINNPRRMAKPTVYLHIDKGVATSALCLYINRS